MEIFISDFEDFAEIKLTLLDPLENMGAIHFKQIDPASIWCLVPKLAPIDEIPVLNPSYLAGVFMDRVGGSPEIMMYDIVRWPYEEHGSIDDISDKIW